MSRRLSFVLFFFLTSILAAATPAGLSGEPTPDWIVANEPGAPAPADAVSGGINYLLVDQQWRLAPVAAYARYTYLVTHGTGLQEAAELSFTYAPDYERLGFHHVRVLRGDQVIDQLDLERFELLREERDRANGLYDGRLTAVLHLRDVRVGDVIDYAFTRHGQNPIFGGSFFRTFSTGWSVPLGRQFARVTVPPGRKLRVSDHGPASSLVFSESTSPAGRVLTWIATDPTPITADKSTPAWHVDYPYVQLGEYDAWSEVVGWGLPLYPLPAVTTDTPPTDPALAAEWQRIRADTENPESRLLAALAFVQEDIRYLGYELGEGSHRPRPPEETLARRFGDCKDKTVLFCTLARALGWDARPALVSTSQGERLPDLLPTPHAFNHVIATVRHPDGRRLWFDPTDSGLAGDLEQHAAPDYRQALVLAPGETGLTAMSVPDAAVGLTRSATEYTSHGYDVPGEMVVTTVYRGARAGSMRSRLLGRTLAELARDYLDYYASDHPGITLARPIEVSDDTAANIITVTEAYSIPVLWKPEENDTRVLQLSASLVSDHVSKPAAGERRTPLALNHPSHTEEEVLVNLHTDWEIEPFNHRVDSAAFYYEKAGRLDSQGRRLKLSYVYRSKKDHVPAADFGRHLADIDSINSRIGYSLTYTPETAETAGTAAEEIVIPEGVNYRSVAAVVLVAFAWAGVWLRLRRRGPSRRPPPLPDSPADPVGIAGWLILPAIGLVIRPIMIVAQMAMNHEGFFNETSWWSAASADSANYSPALAALIMAEVIGNTSLLMISLIVAWLFFKRRRETAAWMIGLLVFVIALNFGDTLALSMIEERSFSAEEMAELIRTLIFSTLWIAYFAMSKRVRFTFTR